MSFKLLSLRLVAAFSGQMACYEHAYSNAPNNPPIQFQCTKRGASLRILPIVVILPSEDELDEFGVKKCDDAEHDDNRTDRIKNPIHDLSPVSMCFSLRTNSGLSGRPDHTLLGVMNSAPA